MKKILILLITFFFAQNYYSQEITVSYPAKIGLGQAFTLQFSVNKQGSNPQIRKNNNFSINNGPSTSTSTNISMINGSVNKTITNSYSYTVTANSVGTHTLPTFTINVDGKTISSPTKTIEVQKDPVQNNNRRQQQYDPFSFFEDPFDNGTQQPQQQQKTKNTDDDMFIRVFLSKTDAYKGEAVTATIKLFTTADITGIEDFKVPSFDDFFAQEMETPQNISFSRETFNNKSYYTAVLKKYILYPRVTGKAKIEKSQLDCVVREIVQRGWFANYESAKRTAFSNETYINVKPLPANDPSNFNGAVGNFTLSIEKNEDTVSINDAVTLKVILKGNGNFNMVELPKIKLPEEFEIYEPEIKNNTTVGTNGLTGTKVWEYTIIPRYPGNFSFGKMSFSYFDLNSRSYKTIKINDLTLFVKKSSSEKDDNFSYSPQKNIEFIAGEDIAFIKKGNLNLDYLFIPLVFKPYYFLFYLIPLLAFLTMVILLRKKIKENSDIAKVKAKKASKISKKRLKKAAVYMKNNEKTEFYKEVIKTLWGYVADKLNIPQVELNRQNVILKLQEKNIDEITINKFISVIEKCEYAHFAPASNELELSYIYKETTTIIEELEQKIK